jgi:DNA polymerase-3 subunit alpha
VYSSLEHQEISAINSLARPAARDIREDYVQTKDGRREFSLIHPSLQRAFGATYGFGLYEECLMYLAQDVAGWSLHEADRLRKLTKLKGKEPKKAAAWRLEFIECAQKNKNIPVEIATKIWDEVVEKFGGYGFNLSHSILYSMTSFYTAYLKAHFPVEFLLANLKQETGSNALNADVQVEKIKQELKHRNVKILPPDINRSEMEFNLEEGGVLVTGLRSLKNVGIEAVEDILEKRPFQNFQDFMVRLDSKYSRSNMIQALAATGALDSFGIPRKTLFLYVSDYKKRLQVWLKKHDPKTEQFSYPWPQEEDWTIAEKYALEQQYLGEAFICGKEKAYGKFFTKQHVRISAIKNLADRTKLPIIIAEIKDIFEFKVKKADSKFFGCTMAKIALEDEYGDRCSLTVFPEALKRLLRQMKEMNSKVKLEKGSCLAFACSVNVYEDEAGLLFDELLGCVPTPPLPADLKAKKVTMPRAKKSEVKPTEVEINKDGGLLKFLEDELEDEGLLDSTEEDENFDD